VAGADGDRVHITEHDLTPLLAPHVRKRARYCTDH